MNHPATLPAGAGSNAARALRACRAGLAFLGADLVVATLCLACLYPLYRAMDASLQSLAQLGGLAQWPAMPSVAEWAAHLADIADSGARAHLTRTLAVSFMAVTVALLLGVTADFAFSGASRQGRLGTLAALGTTMFPQVSVLSTLFELPLMTHTYNHWWGLAMPCLIFTLPFVVWAALVVGGRPAPALPGATPGATHAAHRRSRRDFWPLFSPALVATGMLAFIAAWSEFIYLMAVVLDPAQPSPVAGRDLLDALAPWGDAQRNSPALGAAALLALLIIGVPALRRCLRCAAAGKASAAQRH